MMLAANSQAGTLTPIQAPRPWEKTHAEILGDVFSGVFSADGDNFNNGSVFVTRVDDDNDQTYDAESWSAKALATWAGATQAFGTVSDGELFKVTGDDNNVGGEIFDVAGGNDIAFSRFGNDKDTIDVSTNPSDNPFGQDHVITYTYSIEGEDTEGKYLLFFEDLSQGTPWSDFDYNDLVVEVTTYGRGPIVTDRPPSLPEPASLVLMGLGGLTVLRRRR